MPMPTTIVPCTWVALGPLSAAGLSSSQSATPSGVGLPHRTHVSWGWVRSVGEEPVVMEPAA